MEHNIPLAVADHAGDLFRMMFPDSEIAKRFKCGRTKSKQIVGVLAATQTVVQYVKNTAFSLSTDGSNDKGSEQLYPIVLCYHNNEKVVTDVLSIGTPDGSSTGENIFRILDNEIKKYGLSWENCISFGSDNASVMLGKMKGVAAFIKEQHPNIHIHGCPCHLLHIAAKKGAAVLHCHIEDILTDTYYYLENSSKRLKSLQHFQKETGSVMHKILKHGPTRWLSLHACIGRLIEQWDALSSFVLNEKCEVKKTNDRLLRICSFFEDPSSKLYALFLQYALPKFLNANLMLQREDPVIHLMQRRMHEVATDLMVAFIKPDVLHKAKNIYKVEHHRRSVQKDREDLMIGEQTKVYLESAKDKLNKSVITTFFQDVRTFYSSSLAYIFEKLPMQEDALEHAEVLDVDRRIKSKFSSIRYWHQRFKCLSKGINLEDLEIEFNKFQVDNLSGLDTSIRIDVLWQKISQVKDMFGNAKYLLLGMFMKSLCALPHSNADSERVFSLLRKNKTESRASMSRKLLNDLIVHKMRMQAAGESCCSFQLSDTILRKATHKPTDC